MPPKSKADDELNAERARVLKAEFCQFAYDRKADFVAVIAQGARLAEKGEDNKFACFKGLKSTNINSRFLVQLENYARQSPAVTIVKKTKDGEASAPATPRKPRAGSASAATTPRGGKGKGSASPSKRRKKGDGSDEEEELAQEGQTSESETSDWSAMDEDGGAGRKRKSPTKRRVKGESA